MAPNTAIIITDPYNDFLHPSGKLNYRIATSLHMTNAIANLQSLVVAARKHKIPIYYGLHQQYGPGFLDGWKHATVQQQGQARLKTFEEGSWGVEIYEGLEPDLENGDVVVSKHWCSSSFQNTDLEYRLKQRDTTHLVLAGMVANTCLEGTARYAYELGYNTTMLKDATAGFSNELTKAATELIWPLFANKVTTTKEWIESLEK